MGRAINVVVPDPDTHSTSADMDDIATPMIEFQDLQPDPRGAVVLMNDSNLRHLVVEGSAAVVAQGVSGPERTLAGDDVTGFHWFRFGNGVTLYYPPDMVLTLRVPHS